MKKHKAKAKELDNDKDYRDRFKNSQEFVLCRTTPSQLDSVAPKIMCK